MERKINDLPQVESATLTFATKQLAVMTDHSTDEDQLLLEIQKICASIEDEVTVKPRDEVEKVEKAKAKTSLFEEHKKDILTLLVAAVLFVVGQLTENVIIFIVSYLLLGIGIIIIAG